MLFLKVSIQRVCWRAVILDEGHRIKNMETLTAKSAVLVRCAPYPNCYNHDLQIIAIFIGVIPITTYDLLIFHDNCSKIHLSAFNLVNNNIIVTFLICLIILLLLLFIHSKDCGLEG